MKRFAFLAILLPLAALQSQELLLNNDFYYGLAGWQTRAPLYDDIYTIDEEWGTDCFFDLYDGGLYIYDVQLIQTGIPVRAGYTYTITFGGSGYYGDKSIMVGIGKDGSVATGDGSEDYTSYVEAEGTLESNTYGEYGFEWENTSVTDDNARFFINGGGTSTSFTIAWASVNESSGSGGGSDELALVNQVGFYADGPKQAVIRGGTGGTYEVRSSSGESVWSGTAGPAKNYAPSRESVRTLDFSTLSQTGTFAVYKEDSKISRDFTVSATPHREVATAALKAFYFQRASTALSPTYAGVWARTSGHHDDAVYLHATLPGAAANTISCPKGWYDAGDYGKYIVNSGITTYTLLHLFEHFPNYAGDLSLNIPESSNNTPDLLDEIRWNLDWMMTMQDDDGGVYHKLTPQEHDDEVMPNECTSMRFVFMKTTSAALNFAAVMAKAGRLYSGYDGEFASSCTDAAKAAFAWAEANPTVYFSQPTGVNTGEYGDTQVGDEFFWAAAELKTATGLSGYDSYLQAAPVAPVPDWKGTGCLGLFTILTHQNQFSVEQFQNARDSLLHLADSLVLDQNSGYSISMTTDDFYWGSNSVAANQGVVLLHAYYLTGQESYLKAAVSQLDYLLGRNPLDICYVTGHGQRSPRHPHHRICGADGIADPIPGFLVGGPHTGGQDLGLYGCSVDYIEYEATSYIDNYCSYATNEIAINWNASLAYLSNALEALYAGETPSGFSSDPPPDIPQLISYQPEETRDRRPLLRWRQLEGATSYQVAVSSDASFSDPISVPLSDTFYVPTIDLPLGDVYWRVKSNLSSTWSAVDHFEIVSDNVPVLIAFGGECISEQKPQFTWRSAQGATSYIIKIADNLSFTDAISVPLADTFYVPLADLDYGTYYWKVSSSNDPSLYTSADTVRICSNTGVVGQKTAAVQSFSVHRSGSGVQLRIGGFDRKAGPVEVAVYALNGKKVFTALVADGNKVSRIPVGTEKIGRGTFIVRVSQGSFQVSRRFILR